MENLKLLTDFFNATKNDGRISITHIGVYAALIQFWQENGCKNPFFAFCHQITDVAKISHVTYRKCINDLSDYGYLKYIRSCKRTQASEIYLSINDE